EVAHHHGPQSFRIDPGTFRHVDRELRARPTILGHHGDNSGRTIRSERDAFALGTDAGHFAKSHERTRIGVEDVAQVAGIIAPRMLDLTDPPPQKPFDHCSSPSLRSCLSAATVPFHEDSIANISRRSQAGSICRWILLPQRQLSEPMLWRVSRALTV